VSKKRKNDPPAHPDTAYITVPVPFEIHLQVTELLETRGVDIGQAINAFLVTLVANSQRRAAVGLADVMPIGKCKGIPLDTVIRLEPSYVMWLLDNVESFRLKPDASELLRDMLLLEKA